VAVALLLIVGCCILIDCWLLRSWAWFLQLWHGFCNCGHGFCGYGHGCHGCAIVAVMVVQLWLLQLWNCGFHSHGIVTVMVMELWLLRLLNVAIAFIDLLPELQKATINWLSMAVQCHH